MIDLAVANAAGVHQKNISKYEGGGVVPSALILKEMARALGVTADYLLGSDQDDVIKDTELLKHFKDIDKMPEELKSALITVIEAFVRDSKTKAAYS